MSLWTALFGEKETPKPPSVTVTSMDSNEWLDWMLDELETKDKSKAHQGCYYDD